MESIFQVSASSYTRVTFEGGCCISRSQEHQYCLKTNVPSCQAACDLDNGCIAYNEGAGSLAGYCYISTTSDCEEGWAGPLSSGNFGDMDPTVRCYPSLGPGCFVKESSGDCE